MYLLSIDPGVTTGICSILNGQMSFWEMSNDDFVELISDCSPKIVHERKIVIVEQAPLHGDPDQNIRVNKIESVVVCWEDCEIIRILPGAWKPLAQAQKWAKDVETSSQHVKDAYCMLRYFMVTKGKEYGIR